jgi:hypothetical protein
MIWIVTALAVITLLFTVRAVLAAGSSATMRRDGRRSLYYCPHCGDLHTYIVFPGDTLLVCRSCGGNVFDPVVARQPHRTDDHPSRRLAAAGESIARAEEPDSVWEHAA